MSICIPKFEAQKIKDLIKKGDIPLDKLYDMKSNDRHTMLSKHIGEEMATKVNIEFDKAKLTAQKKAMTEYVKEAGMVEEYSKGATTSKFVQKIFSTPVADRIAKLEKIITQITDAKKIAELQKKIDILKNPIVDPTLKKINNLQEILDPKDAEDFLRDLVASKLGFTVTAEEGKTLSEMTTKTLEKFKAYDKETNTWKSDKEAKEYGASKYILEEYKNKLINPDISVKESFINKVNEIKQTAKENPARAVTDTLQSSIKFIADNSVALVASVDNSFLGRQGLHTLMTHPSSWWNGAKNSFIDFGKTLTGNDMKASMMADIYSRPNFINGEYEKSGILSLNEEQYPTSLPERIWGLGRVFKGSEAAFKGSALRMRIGVYDILSNLAKKNQVEMSDVQIKDLGRMINSLTAKGKWGKTGVNPVVKLVLWAPNMLKANYDVLTAHTFGAGLDTSFTRKQAAYNLIKVIGASAAIMAIANAILPGSAETDSRSSNFGKIKIGNTTFDYTGGASSLIVLASRLITNSSISIATGMTKNFGTGLGQQTRFDAVIDFLAGKTNPITRTIIDLAKGVNAIGQPVTLRGETLNLITPISISNFLQLKDDHSVSAVMGAIVDAIGINANTYKQQTEWQKYLFGNKGNFFATELSRLSDEGHLPSIADIEKNSDMAMMKGEVTPDVYKKTLDDFKTEFKANIVQLMNDQYIKPETSTKMAEQQDYTNATDEQKAKMITMVKSQTLKEALLANGYEKQSLEKSTAVWNEVNTPYGNPTIENLYRKNSDDGSIKGTNPNNEPIYQRFSLAESSKIKSELFKKDSYWKNNGYNEDDTQLDHIVPIEAGGTMTKNNLMLISNSADHSNQKFEDFIGAKYKDGTITRADAIKASIDYKINRSVTLKEVMDGKY